MVPIGHNPTQRPPAWTIAWLLQNTAAYEKRNKARSATDDLLICRIPLASSGGSRLCDLRSAGYSPGRIDGSPVPRKTCFVAVGRYKTSKPPISWGGPPRRFHHRSPERRQYGAGRQISCLCRELSANSGLRAATRTDQSLVWTTVCLENRDHALAIRSEFGSWRKALQAAGVQSAK
jgi:hypothetical protein